MQKLVRWLYKVAAIKTKWPRISCEGVNSKQLPWSRPRLSFLNSVGDIMQLASTQLLYPAFFLFDPTYFLLFLLNIVLIIQPWSIWLVSYGRVHGGRIEVSTRPVSLNIIAKVWQNRHSKTQPLYLIIAVDEVRLTSLGVALTLHHHHPANTGFSSSALNGYDGSVLNGNSLFYSS